MNTVAFFMAAKTRSREGDVAGGCASTVDRHARANPSVAALTRF